MSRGILAVKVAEKCGWLYFVDRDVVEAYLDQTQDLTNRSPLAPKPVVAVGLLSLAVVAGIALWTVSSRRAPPEAAMRVPATHIAHSQVANTALPWDFNVAPKPSPAAPRHSERSLERLPEPSPRSRSADSAPFRRAFIPPPSRGSDSAAAPPTFLIPAPAGIVPPSGGGVFSEVQALLAPEVARPVVVNIAPQEPARLGGEFQKVRLISSPAPVFPALAKQHHVYGAVTVEATVDKQGAVKVNALGGHPYLVRAAKDAVLKRRYQPAMLNGQPIEAKVRITIIFEPNETVGFL